ncbi:MAG: glycosyltransferase family 4 protein [Candidatus Babeliales bacterium]
MKLHFLRFPLHNYFLLFLLLEGSIFASEEQRLSGKRLLILYSCPTVQKGGSVTPGGSSEYKLNLFNYLLSARIDVQLFVVDFKGLQESLKRQGLPFIGMTTSSVKKRNEEIQKQLGFVCRCQKIDLIHCNSPFELIIVKKVAKALGIKVVVTLHGDNLHKSNCLKGIDGVIGVSSGITTLLEQSNRALDFQIKKIAWIPPFFNETKFLSFSPQYTKQAFFKEHFGIEITSDPIVCSIANFYQTHKNHAVLIKAIKNLKDVAGKNVQVMLAGDGKRLSDIRALGQKLGLERQIHFLGHIDCVSELLYHSDINVLTSDMEAFGIALLEGAVMKKPLIGTRGTGMENIITHEATGLLFRKNDERDLAVQLKRLLNNPAYGTQLASNAHAFVLANYGMEATLGKIINFYADVLSNSEESSVGNE